MNINEKTYSWSGNLSLRMNTDFIILHHAATSNASADNIHTIHLKNGWAGIGYHYYVRKDGSIYQARPEASIGAHASGYNDRSVGICFEGNFENETMTSQEIQSARELVCYLTAKYPEAKVICHRDVNATACPGKNFPMDKIIKGDIEDATAIISILNKRGIITDTSLWQKKCTPDSDAYWMCRKLCNKTSNTKKRGAELCTVNDIVWELSERGIITDKTLWLKNLELDEDLYHLCKKACILTQNKAVEKCI